MTRKYTAADFANAQFAEHPDGRWAVRTSTPVNPWIMEMRTWPGHCAKDSEMARDGWVPVIPARTIHDRDVEALCTDTASYERDDYLDGFIQGFQQAGGVILDDPEPTNTERLAELVDQMATATGVKLNPILFAKHLDHHGVTAPNVKGN